MNLNKYLILALFYFQTSIAIAAQDTRMESEDEEGDEAEEMAVVEIEKKPTQRTTTTRTDIYAIENQRLQVECERLEVDKEQLKVSRQIQESLGNISQSLQLLVAFKLEKCGVTLVKEA